MTLKKNGLLFKGDENQSNPIICHLFASLINNGVIVS